MAEELERKLVEFTLEDFAKAEYYCWKSGKDHEVADTEMDELKDKGKDLMAAMQTELQKVEGDKTSEAKLERLARSGEKWLKHQDAFYKARKKANELQAKSRAAKLYWETIQSGLSYRKVEMSRISG